MGYGIDIELMGRGMGNFSWFPFNQVKVFFLLLSCWIVHLFNKRQS